MDFKQAVSWKWKAACWWFGHFLIWHGEPRWVRHRLAPRSLREWSWRWRIGMAQRPLRWASGYAIRRCGWCQKKR